MQRVYRLLKEAREQGIIPWEWIVDETRALERVSTWDDPDALRPLRRPVLSPRLLEPAAASASRSGTRKAPCAACSRRCSIDYAVGFRVMHGFSSATTVHDVAEDDDGRELIVLYVGDFDPSGMFMSERTCPTRLAKYGGDHVTLKRIALTRRAGDAGCRRSRQPIRSKDPRYKWFVANYGRSLLGARRDGPERSARLRPECNRGADRAGGVGALRGRQQGRAESLKHLLDEWKAAR